MGLIGSGQDVTDGRVLRELSAGERACRDDTRSRLSRPRDGCIEQLPADTLSFQLGVHVRAVDDDERLVRATVGHLREAFSVVLQEESPAVTALLLFDRVRLHAANLPKAAPGRWQTRRFVARSEWLFCSMNGDARFVRDSTTRAELTDLAEARFGDMVKAVVDVARRIMVVGGELHADQEALLLDDGSSQGDLWGINLYPAESGDSFIEFDSMINVRPSAGNRSRSVEDPALRRQIAELVQSLVAD